jgi:YD repeat-containing protein
VAKVGPLTTTRTVQYSYDGLQRLTGAAESPGSSFAYTYDLAGNRTSVAVNGTQQASYSYDALNRLTATSATGQTRACAYNGDGTIVSATVNGTATTYAQDLAGGQSQVLAKVSGGTTVDYLYGTERLAALTGGVRSWYGTDGQGSARQGLSDTGSVTANQSYDPFGQPEGGTTPSTFGYTGELQDSATSALYLRARWYQPGNGLCRRVALAKRSRYAWQS